MVQIRSRTINGRAYSYLEKSVRVHSGKTKKVSIYLKDYSPAKEEAIFTEYGPLLKRKVRELLVREAVGSYVVNHIFTPAHLQAIEEMRVGYSQILAVLTESQFRDLFDRFTVNFTYESNAIEGNSLTLKDVTFIIREGKVLGGKDLREVYETVNTRKAIDWILEVKPVLSRQNIIKLHSILVQDTSIATGYKQFPNFLLGRKVVTTPPEKVEDEMERLLSWYSTHAELHPLQLAALFHGKFEQIHPFEDGNGRVGRLLITMILLYHGYPPLIIRKSQRIRYFHALEAFDMGHPDALSRFLLEKYKDTYRKFFGVYVKYLK